MTARPDLSVPELLAAAYRTNLATATELARRVRFAIYQAQLAADMRRAQRRRR